MIDIDIIKTVFKYCNKCEYLLTETSEYNFWFVGYIEEYVVWIAFYTGKINVTLVPINLQLGVSESVLG